MSLEPAEKSKDGAVFIVSIHPCSFSLDLEPASWFGTQLTRANSPPCRDRQEYAT